MNIKNLINRLVSSKKFKTESKIETKNTQQTLNKTYFDEDKIESKPPIAFPKELGKNKWLYPTDEYGKLEKGRTFEN